MDFLDPVARRRHTILLYTGYVLVTIAILLAVAVLMLVVYGYGFGKNGQVVQNGLVFISSKPNPANVYIDGAKSKYQTNVRFNIVSGDYVIQLKRTGYRPWQRDITVGGGEVVRYDYPFLFPESLDTTTVKGYAAAPGMATLSPNSRWLLVEQAGSSATFDMYDLSNPTKAPVPLTIPTTQYQTGGKQVWELASWANDSNHLMLKHSYNDATEFVLIDRRDMAKTVNINDTFKAKPSQVKFINGVADKFYLYSQADQTLVTADLGSAKTTAYLDKVLAFEPYSDDTMLYVTPVSGKTGTVTPNKVEFRLQKGDKSYLLKQLPTADEYPLAIAGFDGDLYVSIGENGRHIVYLYKNPLNTLQENTKTAAAVPLSVMRLQGSLSNISFSAGGRFLEAESGTNFAAYDNRYKKAYKYSLTQPMDAGQPYATWMDGAHLQYVSNGELLVFDYDGTNLQSVVPATNDKQIFYNSRYSLVYTLAPSTDKAAAAGTTNLTSTYLLTPADR